MQSSYYDTWEETLLAGAPSVDNAVWGGEPVAPGKFSQGHLYPYCQVPATRANSDSVYLTSLIKLCSLCVSYHSRKYSAGVSLMLACSRSRMEPLLLGMCQCHRSARSRSKRKNSLVGGAARTSRIFWVKSQNALYNSLGVLIMNEAWKLVLQTQIHIQAALLWTTSILFQFSPIVSNLLGSLRLESREKMRLQVRIISLSVNWFTDPLTAEGKL